jgi:hypothetical protein
MPFRPTVISTNSFNNQEYDSQNKNNTLQLAECQISWSKYKVIVELSL